MNNYIVYRHTTPSKKVYIGITRQHPSKRWKNGKGYDTCTAFARAIKKYGWKNIEHEILAEGLSKEEACEMEQRLILMSRSTNPEHGYNLTSGGEHYEPNDEWRRRLSASNKKYYAEHPEARKRISDFQKGKPESPETIAKIRETMKRFFVENPEERYRCGNSWRGKKRGKHFSARISDIKSKKIVCIETGIEYKSATQAGIALGVCRAGITNVLTGRAKTCKGMTFAYADGGNKDE